MFDLLTRAQKSVMEGLCTMTQSTMRADHIKPSTLGSLAAKGMVNINDGDVYATCIFAWRMTHRPEMYAVDNDCMKIVSALIGLGRRIGAIKVLRERTGLDLKDSVSWVDYHFPK